MKNYLYLFYLLLIISTISCKEDDNRPSSGSVTIDTTKTLASVETTPVSNIDKFNATSGGEVISDGGALITERGVCWDVNPEPTLLDSKTSDGIGIGIFESQLDSLIPGTQYFVRAFAINSVGVAYGSTAVFETEAVVSDTSTMISDVEGNTYPIKKFGDKFWMTENLKTSKFQSGNDIPGVTDPNLWTALNTAGYTINQNINNFEESFGFLYNYYTVSNPEGLCPEGFHVPRTEDWEELFNVIGKPKSEVSPDLKDDDSEYWLLPLNATNSSAFSIRGGGLKLGQIEASSPDGLKYFKEYAFYWTSDDFVPNNNFAYGYITKHDGQDITRVEVLKKRGYSVRCVQD